MKNLIYATFAMIFLIACDNGSNDDGIIWDMYPVNVYLYVEDSKGNDLLDPENENNILNSGIKAIYDGKTLKLNEEPPRTKYLEPFFYGLITRKANGEGVEGGTKNILQFGGFNGAESQEVEFVLDWGDGVTDKISFIHKYDYDHEKDKPIVETTFFLNGEKTSNFFKIVKK